MTFSRNLALALVASIAAWAIIQSAPGQDTNSSHNTPADAASSHGQEEKSPFANVPRLKVPKEVDRVRSILVGTWDAKEHWEKVEGFAPGGDGTGIMTTISGPGEMSIIIDYKALTGPFPTYSGHGVMSWESDSKIYRMAWVQPIWPGVSIETGNFQGATLVMSYDIVEMGKKYIVKNVYSDWTPDSYSITSYLIDSTGQYIKTLTMTLKRRAAAGS